ncbi:FAD dependent oxidoreductase [Phellopilus nigrolimitatus]|nr:FAD dependent oxidoreductase [Phellopilus nigrolimitatus]
MSPDAKQRSVVVLGAGVIGLSIAHVLSADPANSITFVARDMPGSEPLSQGWSSPWAGANWSPIGARIGYILPFLQLPSRVYYDNKESFSDSPWWKDIVRDFRILSDDELPPGVKAGYGFTTISTKPARYLRWMKNELEQRGVVFVHAAFGGNNSIVINASGLGARSLFGTIIVKAPEVKEFIFDNSSTGTSDESTYIIPRPDGTCILGGTFQQDNYDTTVNHGTARRIFERCATLQPGLLPSRGATIISHNVGLRPSRRGGPRVELESVQLPLENELVPHNGEDTTPKRKLKVIHAYGLGPAGYQDSWGVADEVAKIFSQI